MIRPRFHRVSCEEFLVRKRQHIQKLSGNSAKEPLSIHMTLTHSMLRTNLALVLLGAASLADAFVVPLSVNSPLARNTIRHKATASAQGEDLAAQKKKLLGLLKPEPMADPILADPLTKEPVVIRSSTGTVIGGQNRPNRVKYTLQASPNATVYKGDSLSYINLLEPAAEDSTTSDASSSSSTNSAGDDFFRRVSPLVPPPLRAALSASGLVGDEYIPMRDLFTSPAVSYAYERGWRQGFAQAGFPGPDEESRLAMEYFAPVMAASESNRVLVDMSCATGLFTRRFVKSGKYKRVLGCDYSDSMLEEARRRINADPDLSPVRRRRIKSTTGIGTQLDLIRLDVGQIPMQNDAVDALHAGAAMHCWPDLPAAVQEIHRVLKPGGRYFATTFLSSYFRSLSTLPGATSDNMPSRQAFQYFGSVDQLRKLLVEDGGFAREKVFIEVLGSACVVIRAEK